MTICVKLERMPDYTPYLLYTDEQIQDFRRRYATFIGQKEQTYADWINALPVMEKIDYLESVPERNRPAVIGMLCHLQDIGKITVTFHPQARLLHRNPYSIEEWETWCDSQMPKRRKRR